MLPQSKATIIVIVGITGDLAQRKLIPALIELVSSGATPPHFRIIGITRQSGVDPQTLFGGIAGFERIASYLSIVSMDVAKAGEYEHLQTVLADIELQWGVSTQRLFYLSTPAQVAHHIIVMLGASGIAAYPNTALLLEKPFGTDLNSARVLVEHISAVFAPQQVYCIDHYLAKDMVQHVMAFRQAQLLLGHTWDNTTIKRVDVTASESIGIEGRVGFYEQTGALRDLVQSHLLQLVAATLADGESAIARTIALQSLHVRMESLVRGQYEGYREEVANGDSVVETFVSCILESHDAQYAGVPIKVSTGKKLDRKHTEIHIYTDSEDVIFTDQHVAPTQAYERILHSAMMGDHTLFLSYPEILESWRIVTPIQEMWQRIPSDIVVYKAGSLVTDIAPKPSLMPHINIV